MISTHYGKYEDTDGEVYEVSVEDCYQDTITKDEAVDRIKSAIEDRRKTGKSMVGLHFVIRPESVFSVSL